MKVRLVIMNFLQFAVWGAYLTCMGIYLGKLGMGNQIGYFFAMQGLASIFMPALMGVIADRWIAAQRLFGYCHLMAGAFMLLVGWYGYQNGSTTEFSTLFILYSVSVAFYMPTLSLSYSVAYKIMTDAGMDIVKEFPSIRVFGTIGFIVMMWLVDLLDFEQNQNQFIVSGLLSIILFVYSFSLPACPVNPDTEKTSFSKTLGLQALSLFKQKEMVLFFAFSALLGICLHITNGYATPFLNHFKSIPEYADSFGVVYPVVLYSISQISETCCILLIPFFMKRYGIKKVMLIAMFAWVLRFALLGFGNPGDGVLLFVLSMIVYGVAFDFFIVSGSLFVDKSTDPHLRSSAQGLFMLMTSGIAATIGSLGAQTVINAHTISNGNIDWTTCWYIFAAYALVVAIAFALVFHPKNKI